MTWWVHLWPGGTWWSGFDAVWPNMLASGIIFTGGYLVGVRPHIRRIHVKLDKLHRRMNQDANQEPDSGQQSSEQAATKGQAARRQLPGEGAEGHHLWRAAQEGQMNAVLFDFMLILIYISATVFRRAFFRWLDEKK